MAHKENAPLIDRLPNPEDLHYMGPLDPNVLGILAVRLNNFGIGTLGANETATAAVSARIETPAFGESADAVPLHRDPTLDYSESEQEKTRQWSDAYNATRIRLYEQGLDGSRPEAVLDAVRAEIQDVDLAVYGHYFDSIFDEIAPPILRHRVDAWREEHPDESGAWLRVLSAVREEKVDDDFLMNFLQWHNHRVESLQQDPEFAQGIDSAKEFYLSNLKGLEKQSIVAKGSYRRAKRELNSEELQYFVADPFFAAHIRADAYAVRRKSTSYTPVESVTGETTSLLMTVLDTADHEFNHAVLGALPNRWLNEAVTEHLALVLNGRDAYDIYAGVDNNAYMAERDALDALIEAANRINGDEVLSILDFTHAYSQAYTDNGEYTLNQLLTKLDMCFGFNVLDGISGCLIKSDSIMQEKMGENDIHKRQEISLQELRHVLAQQPEQLKQYVRADIAVAA